MAAPFEDWYRQMPVVTRTFMTGAVLTTLAVYLDIVHPLELYLNPNLIFHKGEGWRLITNFLFFDYFGINFLFHMYFLVRHSRMLEESSYRGRTADYVFLWLFGAIFLLALNIGMFYINLDSRILFLAPSLAFVVVYVWARRNPNVRMSFLGLFTFNAPYLPWVILGFGMLLGQSPLLDGLGIVVGHVYYYLEDIYPTISNGRRILRTPQFLKTILDAPVAQQAPRPPAPAFDEHQHEQ
eukprot:TRINITY_DN3954_c0_g1_i3.p1 TRINITY_DN3954_c0_g1~~TRINITY_DN3954_c0_g1_i3.p1  ORF type:complete len:239 (-),score=27.21 TRINITY_DN3954_c0_g1_i3:77-793(-)